MYEILGHPNGPEMFNWLKIRCFFSASVLSDVVDENINRTNEWALTYVDYYIDRLWWYMHKNDVQPMTHSK